MDQPPWLAAAWAEFGVREIPGAGLEAVVAEGTWRLGNPRFALTGAASESDEARSAVVLSLDGKERARFL